MTSSLLVDWSAGSSDDVDDLCAGCGGDGSQGCCAKGAKSSPEFPVFRALGNDRLSACKMSSDGAAIAHNRSDAAALDDSCQQEQLGSRSDSRAERIPISRKGRPAS